MDGEGMEGGKWGEEWSERVGGYGGMGRWVVD